MRCEKCEKEPVEIFSKDEAYSKESYINQYDNINIREKYLWEYEVEENKLLFCTECKELLQYRFSKLDMDTDEYVELINTDDLVKSLAYYIQNYPECINFSELKKVCFYLKIYFNKVT